MNDFGAKMKLKLSAVFAVCASLALLPAVASSADKVVVQSKPDLSLKLELKPPLARAWLAGQRQKRMAPGWSVSGANRLGIEQFQATPPAHTAQIRPISKMVGGCTGEPDGGYMSKTGQLQPPRFL
jgi:hypothetical protein